MAASTVSVNLTVQYTPPSAPANSGNITYQVSASCQAQNVGQIDINPSDTPSTVIPIPFGTVNSAKVLVIKNKGSVDVGVRLNGALADNFKISANGEMAYVVPAAPTATPVTSASIVIITAPTQIEYVEYMTFGD